MFEKINENAFTLANLAGDIRNLTPFEYTGWRDEVLASKDSAYLGTGLLISPVFDVKGKDAEKFLTSICVNNFTGSRVGGLRHAVICNEKGYILADGVCIKLAENHFRLYYLSPVISYYASVSNMEIETEDLTGQEFLLQLAGPKSLEILERVSGESLRDIRFAHHRISYIDNVECRIVRLGMAGTLAYEIHGPIDQVDHIYKLIWEETKKQGGRKLGIRAYSLNHTEAGFPNINIHYPLPWYETPGLREYLLENSKFDFNRNRKLIGSLGDDLEARFKTPYDVGWGFLVKFNHEFPGKTALQEIANHPPKTVVTLEWDADDIGKVFASKFRGRDVTPYMNIDDRPSDTYFNNGDSGEFIYQTDLVLDGEKTIGTSTGRIQSAYYQRMISLGFVDTKYAKEGTELCVLWGNPGTPQMKIHVKVARFPYLDIPGNSNIDVAKI